MTRVQKPEVIEAIQRAAQERGVKLIAAELNKAPSTIYAELNPWGDRAVAKLGLEDGLEIMRLTGDVTALELAAREQGYRLVPIDGDPVQAETAYPTLATVMAQAGDLAIRLRDAMSDGELSARERAELCEAAGNVMKALEPFATTPPASRREVN